MLSPARVVRWPICSANCCSVDSRCLRSAWSMRRTKLRRCWSEVVMEGDGIKSSHMVGFSIERTLAGVENVVSHGEGCIMVDDQSWECCTGLFNTTMDWARVAFKLKWENALGLEHTRTESTRIHSRWFPRETTATPEVVERFNRVCWRSGKNVNRKRQSIEHTRGRWGRVNLLSGMGSLHLNLSMMKFTNGGLFTYLARGQSWLLI